MKRALFALGITLSLGAAVAVAPSCQPAFPTEIPGQGLAIQIVNSDAGTAANPLALTFQTPDIFTVNVQALNQDGIVDTTYNSYVRFSAQPGSVLAVSSTNPSTVTNGRNAQLSKGVANDIQVAVVGAYGQARIVVEDLGYEPVDPLGAPTDGGGIALPQCANGIDDNHNGLVDYPVDPGCYAPNDNTEDGASYAAAASDIIQFTYPSIADVQGINNNGAGTPFPNEQVQMNTNWNGSTLNTEYGVVVTAVSSEGFFVTDIDPSLTLSGYNSVYAYNYSAPALMNPCDRLISFGGTAANFYGFVEVNYPTWSLEEWDPDQRPCLVPEPAFITVNEVEEVLSGTNALTPLQASLVRVPAPDGTTLHIAHKLGPGLIPYTTADGGSVVIAPGAITEDTTSCDYEGTGKIDFENVAEAACEAACTADIECSEYSSYATNAQFAIVMVNGQQSVQITGDGSASPGFDPVTLRGSDLVAFTGNLTYFSGGSQYTIQARCADDIVLPGGTVLPTSPPWPIPDGGVQAPAACVPVNGVGQLNY